MMQFLRDQAESAPQERFWRPYYGQVGQLHCLARTRLAPSGFSCSVLEGRSRGWQGGATR